MKDLQPFEASLARVQAGRNPSYSGFQRPETPEVRAVLERFRKAVADATEEAFDSLAEGRRQGQIRPSYAPI